MKIAGDRINQGKIGKNNLTMILKEIIYKCRRFLAY